MDKENLMLNAETFDAEFAWLSNVITTRLHLYFNQETPYRDITEVPAPDLALNTTFYGQLVRHYNMSNQDRLVILLALAPHLKPHVLDPFFMKNGLYERGYSEFGGALGQQHGGFLPTGETALFLLAGSDLAQRMQWVDLFDESHYFFKHNILRIENSLNREPYLSGVISMSQEYLSYFTDVKGNYRPKYSAQFPAKRIVTNLEWDDLILDNQALEDVHEMLIWLEHHQTILREWQIDRFIKPGYRALFYGPPGTGKTMTAALLGKLTGRDVYRIDLSQVVSKFIGETEKNLASIFDQAENGKWILFFDEADALFGKRTTTKDAKDRYANQEVAYLLQRIEDFPGVAILATNLKSNMDDAFTRRFQSMIYFQIPNAEQRLRLWLKTFSGPLPLDPDIQWEDIAQQYEMSGGSIINVLQSCTISAVQRTPVMITQQDIVRGIRKEFRKEGKTEL